jgi:O-antigen ligase
MQEAAAVVLALLAAVALLASVARTRAIAVLALLVLTPAVLVGQVWNSAQFATFRDHPVFAVVLLVVGIGVLVAAAWGLRRRPTVLPALALAVLPFRIPIESGGTTSNLLVPLYLVVAAGCLAFIVPRLRGEHAEDERDTQPVALALAAIVVLYALQTLYSDDVTFALDQMVFFFAPFALLFLILLEVPWTRTTAIWCLGVLVAVALVLVGIGYVEYETRTLLLNPKVIDTNEFSEYFRVNSLFFDPNIYGRFLAFVMLGVTAALLWARERRITIALAVVLAVLWGGLVLTFSQSSFAALLTGLAILAAVRWSVKGTAAVVVAAGVLAVAIVVLGQNALHLDLKNRGSLNRATAGRVDLIQGGWDLFTQRPAAGYGSGSFRVTYRREHRGSRQRAVSASHTYPITVGAEQGLPGLIAYAALLVTAAMLLLRAARSGPLRAFLLAAFGALVLHTLVYASFLEDPATWAILGVAAGLPPPGREGS